MNLRYRIVDVFSDRPLAGNALCVVLDETPPEAMPRIAREVNLSETTFPTRTGESTYDNRIFTPAVELPFAGHPTLGTAWVLGPGSWKQTTAGGVVNVEVDSSGARMLQPVPAFTQTDEAPLARTLGLLSANGAWLAEAAGLRHLIVVTPQPIEDLRPDLREAGAVAARLDLTTVAVASRPDHAEIHVRVFFPAAGGLAEDPGTGSVAGPIATLAADQFGAEAAVTIRQGAEIGRPCTIAVEVTPDGPWVGGDVAACAEGCFTL